MIDAGFYIDSPDTRSYLREIRYKFTIEEEAYLVWQCLSLIHICGGTLVIADGSGSMMLPVSGGSVRLLDVANALAIYFGERCSGPFHDTYLTFSEHPQLVDLSTGKSLRDKLQIALTHAEVANTNVEAAFQLILDTAVKHHLPQEELPRTCLLYTSRCV